MTRRDMLAGAAVLVVRRAAAARTHISKARVSAITDELGRTQADAIEFAKKHGLQMVELRTVPESKKEFALLTEPELKGYAAELGAAKISVSLLKTSLLKFRWSEDDKRFGRRMEDLASAIRAAELLGTDRIRVFTGARGSMELPAVARTLEEMIAPAERARIRLVIENEATQNVGTSAELKDLLERLPSKTFAANWDAWNAMALKENAWPDGYKALPKDRILNVQVKAEALGAPDKIRWRTVLETLERDGFAGTVSVATEAAGDAFIDKADDAVGELLHIVGQL